MTNFPVANYMSNSARTEAEMKQAMEDSLAATKQLPGGGAGSTLTLAADSITPTAAFHLVETQAAASTDNLAQIVQTNLPDGSLLMLAIATNGHSVVVKHAIGGTGQIMLAGAADFSMTNTSMSLLLRRSGTQWEERDRYYGTVGADMRAFYGLAGLSQNTFTGRQEWAKGINLTAASTLVLGVDGNYFNVIGTTTINSFSSTPKGTRIALAFANDGCLLVQNPSTLLLAFGNYLSRSGDVMEFVSEGAGVYRELSPLGAPRVLDLVATNSGIQASTVETTIYTKVIQGNVLGTNRRLRLTIDGTWNFATPGGGSAPLIDGTVFRLYFGSTVIAQSFIVGAYWTGLSGSPALTSFPYSTSDLGAGITLQAMVIAHGATNAQRGQLKLQVPIATDQFGAGQTALVRAGLALGGQAYNLGVTGMQGRGQATEDSTTTKTLIVTAQHTVADALNYFFLENAVLEILP